MTDSHRPNTAGTRLRPDGKDGPQLIVVSGKRWTAEAEALFLDHLAASCNVSWAAAQTGFTSHTAYNHRRKDAGFAQRWEDALDDGHVRLRTALLGSAIDFVERLRSDPELPLKHMTVREAISLLNRHGGGAAAGRSGRFRPRQRSLDEVRDSILSKLEAIEAARRLEAADGGEHGGEDGAGERGGDGQA